MINSLAISDIKEITTSGGTLTPEEIITLNALAEAARECADSAENMAPARVAWAGNTRLHEPTIQSTIWYNEIAARWWADDAQSMEYALIWAMAHAREIRFFADKTEERETRKEIQAWFKTLNCTYAQLQIAATYAIGADNLLMPPADQAAIKEAAAGAHCAHSSLARDVMACGLGLDADAVQAMAASEAQDILERWFRNRIALAGGDSAKLKERAKDTALVKYWKFLDSLKERIDNGQD